MFRLTTTALIAGSLLGIFVVHVTARGRSFPIEVTGTIKMFDRANQIFTVQSDKRARVLTIAVGRDCKFFQNGAPTGEWILKKGARVRVSYFSTIFTGNIAVKIELNPVPEVKNSIIEQFDRTGQTPNIRLFDSRGLSRSLAPNARFIVAWCSERNLRSWGDSFWRSIQASFRGCCREQVFLSS